MKGREFLKSLGVTSVVLGFPTCLGLPVNASASSTHSEYHVRKKMLSQ
jgi:hypothetical protein